MQLSDLTDSTGATNINASKYIDFIDEVLASYDINTPVRIASFLAQVGHESGGLRYTKEIWGPTPAQAGYEGRKDLGNIEVGDGKKFMGRGLLQTTGRANYTKASKVMGLDLLNHPELLEEPKNALKSACEFWKEHKLNEIADSGDFKLLTKRINGGYNGLTERMSLYKKACNIFV
jgi:putative chitinase